MSSCPFPTLPTQNDRTQSLYLELISEGGRDEGKVEVGIGDTQKTGPRALLT